jgi:hypothetical protein
MMSIFFRSLTFHAKMQFLKILAFYNYLIKEKAITIIYGLNKGMKQITLEVPEDIDEKIAKLLFELGLAIMRRDFHKKAEILAYFEARGWHI